MADHQHCCSSDSHHHHESTSSDVTNKSPVPLLLRRVSNQEFPKDLNPNDDIEEESRTVSQLFDMAWSMMNELQDAYVDTTSDDYRSKLHHAIRLLESLDKRLASLELFSDNEHIDELSTLNIRYLLINAFLAWLHQTKRSKPSQRLANVQQACNYYSKFLTLTRNYDLHQNAIPKIPTSEECVSAEPVSSRNVDMMKMAQGRASKIQGHLKRREEEESMKAFEEALKRDSTDEETKRKFYLSKVRWWINVAFNDLDYLHDEIRVLLQRQALESTNEDEKITRPIPPSRPLKPLVITHDQLQSAVISAGYPSVSTMTVDEFYESLAKRGLAPTPEQSKAMAAGPTFPSATDLEKETVAKEALADKDDPDMLTYLRTKDDYMDEHRRGEGNRHNRS